MPVRKDSGVKKISFLVVSAVSAGRFFLFFAGCMTAYPCIAKLCGDARTKGHANVVQAPAEPQR